MSWRNLFVLLVVFGVLGALFWKKEQDQKAGVGVTTVRTPLLVDFSAEAVRAVRVDNLERAVQIKLERDGQGTWFLTDPVPYPAESGVLVTLLRNLSTALGAPSGGVELDEVGLDPPTGSIELEQLVDGGTQRFRVDIGGVDLDPNQIFVRVYDHPSSPDGEPLVLRTTRSLLTTIDRIPEDYRSRRTTQILGRDVIAVRRSGRAWVADLEQTIDLTLQAEIDGGRWQRRDGPLVTLEPNAIGLIAIGTAQLEVQRFRYDFPEDFGIWGLEEPDFEVEILSRDGESATLQFGLPDSMGPDAPGAPTSWYCRRKGYDHVWEVDGDDVQLLLRPPEDLYDQLLVRARSEEYRRLRLEGPDGVLVIERDEKGGDKAWRAFREGSEEERFHVDQGAVQDAWNRIQNTQLEYPEGLEFVPADPPRTLTITTTDGMRWGGVLGAPYRDPSRGLAGRQFLRFGDQLPGVIEEEAAGLVELGLDAFRSSRIHRVRAVDVARVSLTSGDTTILYRHPNEKEWFVGETRFDAPRDFLDLTETLFALKTEAWLDEWDVALPLEDEVAVELVPRQGGDPLVFRLGRDAEGRELYVSKSRAAVLDGAQLANHATAFRGTSFHDELRGLFAPEPAAAGE